MNIVTGPAGDGQAVLIRAVEPVIGNDIMMRNRHLKAATPLISNGPGKLCMAMGIDRSHNGLDLCNGPLYVACPKEKQPFRVRRSRRVNIDYAVKGKEFPWRFYIADNPFVSKA
jgi:DNA-3-methyladenine glycosylase